MERNCLRTLGLLTMLLIGIHCHAQRQLILLSGDEVVHRFRAGDTFHSKLNGNKKEHWGFLVEITEFSFITSQDSIELKKIKKVLLPGKPLTNKIGRTMFIVGLGYFAIDQFNYTVVQHNDPSLDPDVWKPSLIMVSAGLPLLLFKKKWKKISRGVKLVSVGRDSRFYLVE